MLIGEIISHYRKLSGISQTDLCKDICSISHLSKIERGLTEVSDKVIEQLADRLKIDLKCEVERIENFKGLLDSLLQDIIRVDIKASDEGFKIINSVLYEAVPIYRELHLLIKARYYLLHKDWRQAEKQLFTYKRNCTCHVNSYENQLFIHTQGILELIKGDFKEALITLNKINYRFYNNPEYYYHLATALSMNQHRLEAFYFALKAKDHFYQTNNVKRFIDLETLILSQIDESKELPIQEIEDRYFIVIKNCDVFDEYHRKGILLHNLAFLYYQRKYYQKAVHYYEQVISIWKTDNPVYLASLYGLVNASIDGELLKPTELGMYITQGVEYSKMTGNDLYFHLFELMKLKIAKKSNDYFLYIENLVLPILVENKEREFIETYGNELLEYYYSSRQFEKYTNTRILIDQF